MKNYAIIDGNEACANAAYLFSEVCGIYPITPSSGMATLSDQWSSKGKKNLFGNTVKVIEMQSEAGAAGFVHGSLQGGSLTTTFTASQGLLLMIPSMYKMSGEMLPAVIHVAARSLSTHALSIFGDHQDIYATRQTGFAMLSSASVQDAYNLALVAHLSAIKGSLPFLHFFDGFRTSHELNKIKLIEEEKILPLLDREKVNEFRNHAINLGKNITRGTSQMEDVYFQNTEVRNKYYDALPDIVNNYMERINELADTDYKPFNYYGSKTAKRVIVAMGSVTDTIRSVVDDLNSKGEEVGVVVVRLYRPFSEKYFRNVLPTTTEKIAVLDRTKEPGSIGEPLFLDITNVLKDENIYVCGGRYGLSSKDTTPSQIKAVFDNLNSDAPLNNFTIGITDDVTYLSLPESDYTLETNYKEIKIYGFGSDGMVSASKNMMKVLGDKDEYFVQGYFEYDSKKSNGVTISHLRINDEKINAPYYIRNANIIVVSKDAYLRKYEILNTLRKDGIFLLNTSKCEEELNDFLPNNVKEQIINKNITFYIINAHELAKKYNLNGKINNIITMNMLNLLNCNESDINSFKSKVEKTYESKGKEVVKNNLRALEECTRVLIKVDTSKLSYEHEENKFSNDVITRMINRTSNNLKVSDFVKYADGTFEGGTSKLDKRKVCDNVPKWDKSKCIECNQCAFVCPHSIIRPFSLTDEELNKAEINKDETIPSLGEKDKNFYLGVCESNCTACGLCVNVCPGKNGEKALKFDTYNDKEDKRCDKLTEIAENKTPFNKYTIKGIGFEKPKFEFCGACAGCGETAYLRTLTELYGDEIVIANATGCSSIYGASLPSTPYNIPWISSLFEDNAEFGYGIHSSYLNARKNVKNIMEETLESVNENVKNNYEKWLNNMENAEITKEVKEALEKEEIPNELKELINYIPSRTVWIIGGDGWAYDIGYGGLDHVLATNENIKILVLDTEVYSNTGGQKSKSTKASAIAEFAQSGKRTNKKDLFRIAMATPNVYIASISLGANMNQTIKAFKEAQEHDGPSLIIAYAPCIAHGITGGLTNRLEEEKLLVESGYNILMRYLPNEEKVVIDSKEPDFSKYEEVFKRELRYKNLVNYNSEEYNELYEMNKKDAEKRFNYYKKLSEKNAE